MAAEPVMWPGRISAITLFVEDLEAAKRFYGGVFDLPVMFEDDDSTVFDFGNTIINLLKTTAAGDLIEPGPVASRDRPWGVRTASFADPGGHIWEIAQS